MSQEEPRSGRVHPLRRERTLRGWSQQYVADAIEAPDASYVSRWERGVVSPSPHYQERLCRLFGRNAEELGLLELGPEEARAEARPELPAAPSAAPARRRPRRRPRLAALAAGLAAATAGVLVVTGVLRRGPAPPATGESTPALYGCESGWYCFYAGPGFGGRRLNFHDCGGRQSLDNYGFGMRAASWVNTSRHTVFVYDGAGMLLWKEEPRSAASDVGPYRQDRAVVFDTVC